MFPSMTKSVGLSVDRALKVDFFHEPPRHILLEKKGLMVSTLTDFKRYVYVSLVGPPLSSLSMKPKEVSIK